MQAFESLSSLDGVAVDAAENAVPQGGMPLMVPLNKLFLSRDNVRKVRNKDSIAELAALIDREGLLYPLCVSAEMKKGTPTGRYAVFAGGRRLAALQLLAEQGRFHKSKEVACSEFDAARAVALSLAENAHEAMHPADAVVAFRTLVTEGQTIAQIASSCGVSELTVERRLAMANLAPMFLDMWRAGSIEPKQLQALALTTDPAKQVSVWNSLGPHERTYYKIEKALTHEEMKSSDKIARFVGLDAYKAAGGKVRRDLFGSDEECFLQDSVLVTQLADARLETVAADLRAAGWKWVEVGHSFTYSDKAKLTTIYPVKSKPSDDEAEALADVAEMLKVLRADIYKLDTLAQDDDRELTDEEEKVWEGLQQQYTSLDSLHDEMLSSLSYFPKAKMATAGVMVSIDHAGRIEIDEGHVRPEDRKAAAADSASAAGLPAPVAERAAFSEKLMLSLTAHKTGALTASLISNPHVALVAFLHHVIIADGAHRWSSSPFKVSMTYSGYRVGELATNFGDTEAAKAIQAATTHWGERLPTESAELFAYLMAQDQTSLVELLAFYVARTVDVTKGREGSERGFDVTHALSDAVSLDMADWWVPSPAHYLDHVPKAKMIEAVTEAAGEVEARDMPKMKKADAIATADAKLIGKRWLPRPLRKSAPVAVVCTPTTDDDSADE